MTGSVTSPAISTAGLGKRYRIGRSGATADQWIWALKDATFDVAAGEVVGIVGANGSGKSTLLKVLCRITSPTIGRATVCGRIGSLLEVGTGFHPDLTGRDNVFLNGAILGMRRAEIAARFDEIVEFAELRPFIDTPVKRYSSGMYLRLAFAVAAHLDTDVLFVDEVLAVGDLAFQKKCLDKVRLVAREGRTVLFVSHNMVAVEDLCDRAIWLDRGVIARDGRPHAVIGAYTRAYVPALARQVWEDVAHAPGSETIRIKAAGIRPSSGTYGDVIDVATEFLIELEFWQLQAADLVTISVFVCRDDGLVVFNTGTLTPAGRKAGVYRETGRVPANLMNDGFYGINVEIVYGQRREYLYQGLLAFHVADRPDLRGGWFGEWPGAVRPILEWRTEQAADAPAGSRPL